MSYSVHAMDTKKGPRYRIYSNGGDYYVTESLTEDELLNYDFISTLERAAGMALMDHHNAFAPWIKRAKKMKGNRWSGKNCPYSQKALLGYGKELERLQGGGVDTSFRKLKDGRRVLKITVTEARNYSTLHA